MIVEDQYLSVMLATLTEDTVDFVRVRDVKAPNRANCNDAGTDIYVPEYNEKFLADLIKKNPNRNLKYSIVDDVLSITIAPHERILIPGGIKVNIYNKWTYLKVDNKSGVANKQGLIFTSDIIDADYRGECHIGVVNTSDEPVEIYTGMKIVQLIQMIKLDTKWNEITEDEFNGLKETDRGAGGFGSSGLN